MKEALLAAKPGDLKVLFQQLMTLSMNSYGWVQNIALREYSPDATSPENCRHCYSYCDNTFFEIVIESRKIISLLVRNSSSFRLQMLHGKFSTTEAKGTKCIT
eukprot:m.31893 g.31893  ORF g.31893 m.31893 type:complete len:103 (+) comp31573_c0_seq2:312-620(+)